MSHKRVIIMLAYVGSPLQQFNCNRLTVTTANYSRKERQFSSFDNTFSNVFDIMMRFYFTKNASKKATIFINWIFGRILICEYELWTIRRTTNTWEFEELLLFTQIGVWFVGCYKQREKRANEKQSNASQKKKWNTYLFRFHDWHLHLKSHISVNDENEGTHRNVSFNIIVEYFFEI